MAIRFIDDQPEAATQAPKIRFLDEPSTAQTKIRFLDEPPAAPVVADSTFPSGDMAAANPLAVPVRGSMAPPQTTPKFVAGPQSPLAYEGGKERLVSPDVAAGMEANIAREKGIQAKAAEPDLAEAAAIRKADIAKFRSEYAGEEVDAPSGFSDTLDSLGNMYAPFLVPSKLIDPPRKAIEQFTDEELDAVMKRESEEGRFKTSAQEFASKRNEKLKAARGQAALKYASELIDSYYGEQSYDPFTGEASFRETPESITPERAEELARYLSDDSPLRAKIESEAHTASALPAYEGELAPIARNPLVELATAPVRSGLNAIQQARRAAAAVMAPEGGEVETIADVSKGLAPELERLRRGDDVSGALGYAVDVAEAMPQLAAQVAMAYTGLKAAGFVLGAVAPVMTSSFDDTYTMLIEAGKSPADAEAWAWGRSIADGAMTAGTSKLEFSFLTKNEIARKMARQHIMARVFTNAKNLASGEFSEEFVQTMAQEISEAAVRAGNSMDQKSFNEIFNNSLHAALVGAGAGGAMGIALPSGLSDGANERAMRIAKLRKMAAEQAANGNAVAAQTIEGQAVREEQQGANEEQQAIADIQAQQSALMEELKAEAGRVDDAVTAAEEATKAAYDESMTAQEAAIGQKKRETKLLEDTSKQEDADALRQEQNRLRKAKIEQARQKADEAEAKAQGKEPPPIPKASPAVQQMRDIFASPEMQAIVDAYKRGEMTREQALAAAGVEYQKQSAVKPPPLPPKPALAQSEVPTPAQPPTTQVGEAASVSEEGKGKVAGLEGEQAPQVSTEPSQSDGYFSDLIAESENLTKKGQQYLDSLPPIPTDEVAERLYNAAMKIFRESGEDFDKVPDYVATIADGGMPFYGVPRSGSLNATLGFSPTAQDARLRNLLEIAEGRETKELDFPTMAVVPEDATPQSPQKKAKPKPEASNESQPPRTPSSQSEVSQKPAESMPEGKVSGERDAGVPGVAGLATPKTEGGVAAKPKVETPAKAAGTINQSDIAPIVLKHLGIETESPIESSDPNVYQPSFTGVSFAEISRMGQDMSAGQKRLARSSSRPIRGTTNVWGVRLRGGNKGFETTLGRIPNVGMGLEGKALATKIAKEINSLLEAQGQPSVAPKPEVKTVAKTAGDGTKVGDKVEVFSSFDDTWSPATITKINKNGTRLYKLDDGSGYGELNADDKNVRPAKTTAAKPETKAVEKTAGRAYAEPSEVVAAVTEKLKGGGKVYVRTALRTTPLSKPSHIRIKNGKVQIPRGKNWDTLLPEQVNDLANQVGMKAPETTTEPVDYAAAPWVKFRAENPTALILEKSGDSYYPKTLDDAEALKSLVGKDSVPVDGVESILRRLILAGRKPVLTEEGQQPSKKSTPQGQPSVAAKPETKAVEKTAGDVSGQRIQTSEVFNKDSIELTPQEEYALKMTKMRGAKDKGDGIWFIPENLMNASRKEKLRNETESNRKSLPRGGRNVEIKTWSDVTGDPYAKGYAILDRRARNAERSANSTPQGQQPSPKEPSNAIQKQSTKQTNESSSPQPTVRKEGGNQEVSSQGVREGRQEETLSGSGLTGEVGSVPTRHQLKKPISGKNGAKVVGYHWASTVEEGMFRDRKVSDWTKSGESTGTGRKIVHHYYVQHPDGRITIEGIGSAQNILGIAESRLQTLAKNEIVRRREAEKRDKNTLKVLIASADSTPQGAARSYRVANHSPMRSSEANDAIFNSSVLFEKDGKYIRSQPDNDTATLLTENGWSIVDTKSQGQQSSPSVSPKETVSPSSEKAVGSETTPKSEKASESSGVETDPARRQEIQNSINEGELILQSGRSISGKKLSPEQLGAVSRSVESAKAKLGITTPTQSSPASKQASEGQKQPAKTPESPTPKESKGKVDKQEIAVGDVVILRGFESKGESTVLKVLSDGKLVFKYADGKKSGPLDRSVVKSIVTKASTESSTGLLSKIRGEIAKTNAEFQAEKDAGIKRLHSGLDPRQVKLALLHTAEWAVRLGNDLIKGGKEIKARFDKMFDEAMQRLKSNGVNTDELEKRRANLWRRTRDLRRAIAPTGTIDTTKLSDIIKDAGDIRKAMAEGRKEGRKDAREAALKTLSDVIKKFKAKGEFGEAWRKVAGRLIKRIAGKNPIRQTWLDRLATVKKPADAWALLDTISDAFKRTATTKARKMLIDTVGGKERQRKVRPAKDTDVQEAIEDMVGIAAPKPTLSSKPVNPSQMSTTYYDGAGITPRDAVTEVYNSLRKTKFVRGMGAIADFFTQEGQQARGAGPLTDEQSIVALKALEGQAIKGLSMEEAQLLTKALQRLKRLDEDFTSGRVEKAHEKVILQKKEGVEQVKKLRPDELPEKPDQTPKRSAFKQLAIDGRLGSAGHDKTVLGTLGDTKRTQDEDAERKALTITNSWRRSVADLNKKHGISDIDQFDMVHEVLDTITVTNRGGETVEIPLTGANLVRIGLHNKSPINREKMLRDGLVMKGKDEKMSSRNFTLDEGQIEALLSQDTKQHKYISDLVDLAYAWMNQQGRNLMNETSQKVYGFDIAMIEEYAPMNVAFAQSSNPDERGIESLEDFIAFASSEGYGILKSRKGSGLPFVVDDGIAGIASHVEQVANYHSWTEQIRWFQDLMRVDNNQDFNLRGEIEARMGKEWYDNAIERYRAVLGLTKPQKGVVAWIFRQLKKMDIMYKLGFNANTVAVQFSLALTMRNSGDMTVEDGDRFFKNLADVKNTYSKFDQKVMESELFYERFNGDTFLRSASNMYAYDDYQPSSRIAARIKQFQELSVKPMLRADHIQASALLRTMYESKQNPHSDGMNGKQMEWALKETEKLMRKYNSPSSMLDVSMNAINSRNNALMTVFSFLRGQTDKLYESAYIEYHRGNRADFAAKLAMIAETSIVSTLLRSGSRFSLSLAFSLLGRLLGRSPEKEDQEAWRFDAITGFLREMADMAMPFGGDLAMGLKSRIAGERGTRFRDMFQIPGVSAVGEVLDSLGDFSGNIAKALSADPKDRKQVDILRGGVNLLAGIAHVLGLPVGSIMSNIRHELYTKLPHGSPERELDYLLRKLKPKIDANDKAIRIAKDQKNQQSKYIEATSSEVKGYEKMSKAMSKYKEHMEKAREGGKDADAHRTEAREWAIQGIVLADEYGIVEGLKE